MKHLCEIWVLLIAVALIGCDRPAPGVETELALSLQSDLIAIDTLMQTYPDSALTLLLDEEKDDPYYQLLLSEALYKNDYAQANRNELLAALAYFDSVQDPFLSARCHYMNGVGFYEMDSVVPACEEYMKAIQIMEEHYPEKELVGYKAKFMALTYTRLCVLFSDQYLHKQAICWGKNALLYYNRYNAEPWHIPWMLNKIGSHYEILKLSDSADYFYRSAIDILPDTNNLMYRDISSHLAFLLYESGENKTIALNQLYHLAEISQEETEKIIRYANIGTIYYLELQYDSAWKYLTKVYLESTNIRLKKQAAEWLVEICKSQNNYSEIPVYTEYLAQFAIQNETLASVKSCLTDLFLQYEKNNQKLTQNSFTRLGKLIGIVFGCLVLVIGSLYGFNMNRNKNKQLYQEKQIADLKQKWQDAEESLMKEKKATEKMIKANSFTEEPICAYILNLVKEQNFKAKIDYINYKDFALDNNQIHILRNATDVHYGCFLEILKERYPKLSDDDLNYCCLYLLGLKEADIAALMQRSFSTVCYRSRKIRGFINSKEPLYTSLNNLIKTL